MNIEEAKTDIEKQIISWDGIIGIGVVSENDILSIDIAIEKDNQEIATRLNKLINNSHWQGYPVRIIRANDFNFHNK